MFLQLSICNYSLLYNNHILIKFHSFLSGTANILSNNTTSLNTLQIADELEKENHSMGKKLKAIKNHIQVVTCFDGQVRKTTQI